jgi:hypothetical protein
MSGAAALHCLSRNNQEHPVVLPHVSHFMQVPFGTSLELPHSLHISAPASRVWSKLRFALLGRRKPVLGLRGFQRGRGVAVAEEGGRAGGGDRGEVASQRLNRTHPA